MESNTIPAETAEHGDNSPGCSLKVECPNCGRDPNDCCGNCIFNEAAPVSRNIRQYITRPLACEKDVSKPEPFPSILESAEQKRRVDRNHND
jgi:hypothetical protein